MEYLEYYRACRLCPRACGVDRTAGEVGYCGMTPDLKVARAALHAWEEPSISGKGGSGTVFFSGCGLGCIFCQNRPIALGEAGREISVSRLADIFDELEAAGAENINLVTAAHFVPSVLAALSIARGRGNRLPIVYNSGGYEKIDTLQRIDEFVDIYLPDMKFYSSALSQRYLGKENYFDIASEAIAFMAQKTLRMTKTGKMLSGCIVRHLVMPLCVSDSKALLRWFKKNLPSSTYLSLMSQYTPFGNIERFPELNRAVTAREYNAVVDEAFALGIENLFLQERDSSGKGYIPSWDF